MADGDAKVRWACTVALGCIAEEGVGECCDRLRALAQVRRGPGTPVNNPGDPSEYLGDPNDNPVHGSWGPR